MMGILVGRPGQTKTLGLTALTYLDYLDGNDVMANYRLTFPKERGCGKILPLDIESLVDPETELENLTLSLTEMWTLIDSRRSGSKRNLRISRLYLQSRKRGMNVLGDTQRFMDVDPRFRRVIDVVFLCRKLDSEYNHVRDPLWTDPEGYSELTPYPPDADRPMSNPVYFKMGTVFPLYNTNEIIEVLELSTA